jgi:hypothetical protein
MVARSARYKTLLTRCRELRAHMLPARFSATGSYSDRQQDRARGYRLLIHAEIESYLEDRVREVGLHAVKEWDKNRKMLKATASLLAYAKSTDIPPEKLPKYALNSLLDSRVGVAYGHHADTVRENHGLRARNLMNLLVPIGIDERSLDASWVVAMDTFGSDRGDVAHKSLTVMVVKLIDPQTEHATVQTLLSGLKDVDSQLDALLK